MNEYDSDRIIENLKKMDYIKTDNPSDASLYVLNTCHIREKATEKVYHDIGRIKKIFRNRTKPIVIVAGCVAQAEGEVIMNKEKYVDGVVGPQSYHALNKMLLDIDEKKQKNNYTEFEAESKFDDLEHIKNTNSKISSYLTIQEGCDKFCKFCVVPYTRGPEFSRKFTQIISEAKQLISNGSKEIILLGQNVNAYNDDGKRLSHLIIELEKLSGLERIRYTTSHPKDMSNDLIKLYGISKKLMPLLHLPVQSGSDNILKKMNRKHSVNEYLTIIEKLRSEKKNIKFSSDFIIAYPGETEEDFDQSVNLIKSIRFVNSYSYIFSPRLGTPAAKFKTIDKEVAKKRLIKFQKIAEDLKKTNKRELIGKVVKVLFENKITGGKFFGRDEYQNPVIVSSNQDIVGKIIKVKVTNSNSQTVFGNLVNHKNAAA